MYLVRMHAAPSRHGARGLTMTLRCMGNFKEYRTVPVEEILKVNKEYPEAFLRQAALPTAKENGQVFRFVFIGGIVMSRDQNANLWLLPGMRKQSVRWLRSDCTTGVTDALTMFLRAGSHPAKCL